MNIEMTVDYTIHCNFCTTFIIHYLNYNIISAISVFQSEQIADVCFSVPPKLILCFRVTVLSFPPVLLFISGVWLCAVIGKLSFFFCQRVLLIGTCVYCISVRHHSSADFYFYPPYCCNFYS